MTAARKSRIAVVLPNWVLSALRTSLAREWYVARKLSSLLLLSMASD